MIRVKQKGDFKKLTSYLTKLENPIPVSILEKYGQRGVQALSEATPKDTGKTAKSWTYKIEQTKGRSSLVFSNNNINDGVPIAIVLQYGHGTRNGGWVEGRDYINPAIRPIFDELADESWKEVTKV